MLFQRENLYKVITIQLYKYWNTMEPYDNTPFKKYVKTDEQKYIHKNKIEWMFCFEECLYLCDNNRGCGIDNLYTLCNKINPSDFKELYKKIDETTNLYVKPK